MALSPENQMRLWAIRRAAVYRDLFRAAVLRALPVRWFYRWLFADGRGGLSDPGERVLSDLRDFCHASDATIFDSDPLVMARREGRREVFMRMQNFLNLDETKVRNLMEIDDGFGD